MDHYTELVLAAVQVHGRGLLRELDLQVVIDASMHGFQPVNVPDYDGIPDGAIEWRPQLIGPNGEIQWSVNADCEACGGKGTMDAYGKNDKRYSVECQECFGSCMDNSARIVIVTDDCGNYLRQEE